MSSLRLIHQETNALGVTRRFWADDEANITVEAVQDLEPLIERNKRAANDRGKKITSDVVNPIATIPPIFQLKFLKEEGWWIGDVDKCDWAEKKLKQKLNDPDWRFLRTSELAI